MTKQSSNKILTLGDLAGQIKRSLFSNNEKSISASDQMLLPSAVVGLVDIVSSTKVSNSVDLFTDWEIKERFLNAATERAAQTGMRVLNHTGDGFMFLANGGGGSDWAMNLISFYEALTSDFERIFAAKAPKGINLKSGLRFGVAVGPGILGCLAGDPRCLTVVGPEANLAARLCSLAAVNELVVSSRVWDQMKMFMGDQQTKRQVYSNLKGFDVTIPAIHITREQATQAVAENILADVQIA